MILVDFSQIVMASLHGEAVRGLAKGDFNEDFFKHMVLNQLRMFRVKFRSYGDMVICCDGRNYWRKQVLPEYKGERKKYRDASKIDFKLVFQWMDALKKDIREHFPYRVIEVDTAEADDIIGHLVAKHSIHEKIVIVSADGDFQQLQRFPNVEQYSPRKKRMLKCDDPERYLAEHIIRGDRGDGIANVFSDPDSILNAEKKQKKVYSRDVERWVKMSPEQFCKETGVPEERYRLNETLIDLTKVPSNIRQEIDKQMQIPPAGKGKILPYLIKHRMKHLIECMSEF